ncbi:MAG TPA: sugar ABC transporter permease [Candidatus Binataceae bacterium]|nr:sugar ABC transporter permease [Candidatus Binataceae bacterium]
MDRATRRLRVIFVALPVAFMTALLLLPALQGLALSFNSNGRLSLSNYAALGHDPMFWRALANNLIVPGASLALELAVGLALALFLSARRRPGAVVEIAAILPFAIPEIVLLALARFILIPRGYLNGALALAGIGPLGWLHPGSALALFTVIVVDAWHVTPVVMLILMAGLETIPREVYDAALLDGAGPMATFRHVTLPLLTPAIAGALVLRGVDALRIFSTTLVLTGAEGVPVLSTYAYQMWSDAQRPHLAMAASAVLALLITAIGAAALPLARRFANEAPR